MKNLKMSLSALAVLAIVGSALAFNVKPYSLGNVFCFTTSVPPSNPNATCTGQTGGTQKKINTVNSGGTTSNPCAAQVAYISTSTSCLAAPSGTEFLATGE